MGDLMTGVASTALLVNHSRFLRPELSRDRYARAWIPSDRREQVAGLWSDYADAVYRHDDVVTSVRGRMALELAEQCLRRDPATSLVVVGAGFTSYPWLLTAGQAIEVDQPDVAEAKRQRAEQLVRQGVLPPRRVRYEGLDLDSAAAVERLRQLVADEVPAGGSVTVVVEGVLYYLTEDTNRHLLEAIGDLGRPLLGAMLSYWPESERTHPVLERQAAWFRRRGVPERASYLDHSLLRSCLGTATELLGPEEMQRRAGVAPVVPSEELVPEWVAVTCP